MRRSSSMTAALVVLAAGWIAAIPARAQRLDSPVQTIEAPPAEPAPSGAQPKGKPSLTAYYAKGFSDAAWQQAAFGKVAKSWAATTPPALGKKAVVISQITREGKVLDAKLGTPSGSAAWDKAALEAVKKAAPFAALPKTWMESGVEVHWHFAYGK